MKSSNQYQKPICVYKEITELTYILDQTREFYEALFKKQVQKTAAETKKKLLALSIFQNSSMKLIIKEFWNIDDCENC